MPQRFLFFRFLLWRDFCRLSRVRRGFEFSAAECFLIDAELLCTHLLIKGKQVPDSPDHDNPEKQKEKKHDPGKMQKRYWAPEDMRAQQEHDRDKQEKIKAERSSAVGFFKAFNEKNLERYR